MAHDKIKLNYEQADQMAKTFKAGSQQLQRTMQEMQKISQTLQEGGLLGRGGKAYVEVLNNGMTPSLKKLIDKFNEMEKDVQAAITYMRQADSESKKQFG